MHDNWDELVMLGEVDMSESDEYAECARELCKELPETRARALQELREIIYERGEVVPQRMDDDYLVKFLRARQFVPARAHRVLVKYYKFRNQNPHLYDNVDAFALKKLGAVYCSPLFDRPDVGRITIMRFGLWDTRECSIEDVVRGGVLMMEMGTLLPKLQILGGTAVFDLEGLSLSHVSRLTPAIAGQIVSLMGAAFPTHIRSFHVVNNSWIMDTFYYLFKRLIPAGMENRIFFHGSDMSSLHKHIDPDVLPERYGGNFRKLYTFGEWVSAIQRLRTKAVDHELRNLGYLIL